MVDVDDSRVRELSPQIYAGVPGPAMTAIKFIIGKIRDRGVVAGAFSKADSGPFSSQTLSLESQLSMQPSRGFEHGTRLWNIILS